MMTFPANAVGAAAGPFPATLIDDLAAEISEHGFEVAREGAGLAVTLGIGRVEAVPDGGRFEVRIGSQQTSQVQEIREAFLHLLDHAAPGLADRMAWQGDLPQGTRPPNFRTASVVSVETVTPNFLRMTLAADNVADFAGDQMHFRLAIPPRDRKPVWPHLDVAGRTIWPKGEDALHRPAYTFVEVDPKSGCFSFDLYIHQGGVATEWARTARPGDVVGMMGPGGGTPPPGDFLLMAGDETALPAIRRILEVSPAERRGHVFIELGDGEDRCEIAAPDGVRVEWLVRGDGQDVWERIAAVPFPGVGASRFVWIAAERELARKARAHFRNVHAVTLDETYISAYWTK
ncbi:siderophore-interacting protein [Jiella endophytica]|uniref:Siderophore-interacting protein n=1 Tax=Jiella endophytica TaxID=2558362 RepID=A0A4Y8RSC2_9HYPH|nr:siderophore-interacting protein [Jiella endophytica]TFF27185.1 siderophore-interacting protein [Jiella endophytica]